MVYVIKEWKYYIIKKDWNFNVLIECKDLELFCIYNDGGKLLEKLVLY